MRRLPFLLLLLCALVLMPGCSRPNAAEAAVIKDLNRLYAATLTGTSQTDYNRMLVECRAALEQGRGRARSIERFNALAETCALYALGADTWPTFPGKRYAEASVDRLVAGGPDLDRVSVILEKWPSAL